jgi:hypothetical protein
MDLTVPPMRSEPALREESEARERGPADRALHAAVGRATGTKGYPGCCNANCR